jgi:hypothetical protein
VAGVCRFTIAFGRRNIMLVIYMIRMYMYMVSSTLDKDAVFKIAGSVKPKK